MSAIKERDPNRYRYFNFNFNCSYCNAVFYDEPTYSEHLKNLHRDKFNHRCPLDSFITNSMIKYSEHCQQAHNRDWVEPEELMIVPPTPPILNYDIGDVSVTDNQDNTRGIFKRFGWKYSGGDDLHTTMNNMRDEVKEALSTFIDENTSVPTIKFQLTAVVEFAKLVDAVTDEWTISFAYFNSKTMLLLDMDVNFSDAYDQCVAGMWRSIDKYIRNGSGWVFRRIHQVLLNTYRYQPFAGSSYIPTPKFLANKRCIINIKNGPGDNQCFKWCVLAHKFGHKVNENSKFNSSIYNREKWVNSIDWNGINFPTSLLDIDVFERNNKDWAIHVIRVTKSITSEKIIPTIVRKTKYFNCRKYHMVLLMIVDEKTGNRHYTLVTDHNRLLKTNFTNKSKLCWNCMTTFRIRTTKEGQTKDILRYNNHVMNCIKNDAIQVTFPNYKKMKFRHIGHMKRNEFNITADFECLMGKPPIIRNDDEIIEKCEEENKISILSTHKVFSVALHVTSDRFQDQFEPITYREGEDGIENAGYMFCKILYDNMEKINHLYQTECNKPMDELTENEQKEFDNGRFCSICEEEIKCKLSHHQWINLMKEKICTDDPTEKDKLYVDPATLKGPKVRDHCHWTGKYRGIAHAFCNSQFRERGKTVKTSVFLHNGSRYDNHVILQNLYKFLRDNKESFENPSVIAKTMETFMQIKLDCNTLIKDSLNFLGGSLDKLVKNLKDEGRKTGRTRELFKHTFSYFDKLCQTNEDLTEEDFDLLTRKNVYPYEYMTDLSKCLEKSLPPIEAFYSHLTNETISVEDYNHGKKVFQTFKCKDIGAYTDLYVLTDTLLLSDVMENFRKQTYDNFKLDPVYYMSTPSLTMDCALKYTKSEFEILDDIEKTIFADNSILGGYSAAHEPFFKANNKLLENYDNSKLDTYILYLDANNLYGTGLRGLLPYEGLEFLSDEELIQFMNEDFIKSLSENSSEGYFIQCDLEYPEELHDSLAHIALPLIPEHMEIEASMLSNYQRGIADNLTSKLGGKKVVTTLYDKKEVILHYVNLKQCLKYGLKLKKVHKVMKFKQGYQFKAYVDFCTECRKNSKNDFEKSFWKLMINSLFGKLCENIRKRREVKLVDCIEGMENLLGLTAKPGFLGGTYYEDELFGAWEMEKTSICLDKPRYVGAAILNLSKTIMFDFHYEFIMKKFPTAQLIFTDTDSLCYYIRSEENVYDVLKRSNYMDFSNYPPSSTYYSNDSFLKPGNERMFFTSTAVGWVRGRETEKN